MKSNKTNSVKGLFITGTDTGVGKTHVTQQILQQLSAQSISCVAMKPVASGAIQTANGLRNDDAVILQKTSSVHAAYELINPYCFEPAIAPHLAAQLSGVTIEPEVILNAFYELSSLADIVIVEGVGGWQVPLNEQVSGVYTIATLAEQLQLPVVLVVGLRLGCMNHALLSHDSIYNSNSQLAGWIANSVDKTMLYGTEQIQFLKEQLPTPLLAHLSWCENQSQSSDNFINDEIIDLDHLLIKS
ncbi:MAG: dethiobiotin synthase [Gammaproteobacteria bacterium]